MQMLSMSRSAKMKIDFNTVHVQKSVHSHMYIFVGIIYADAL